MLAAVLPPGPGRGNGPARADPVGIIGSVEADPVEAQTGAALRALTEVIGMAAVVGAYRYGSASDGGLRPDSDLDLLVVTSRPLERPEKQRLVDALLPISGRATRPPAWRPLELTVVAQSEVRPWRYPPRIELQYGEWLRAEFLAGAVEPDSAAHPDLAVLVTMARRSSTPLIGPPAADVLDPVPPAHLARAMVDGIPSLLADLADDTRNVLLTLARIWCTLDTGEIRSKDEAADWALARLPTEARPMLARARDLYRQGGWGTWDGAEAEAARTLADRLVEEIRRRVELA